MLHICIAPTYLQYSTPERQQQSSTAPNQPCTWCHTRTTAQTHNFIVLLAQSLFAPCAAVHTGRCRQLQRCFEVLDRMTAAGVPSNSITYTCLIEAAVLSGDVDMAQRVFARAMATGVTNSVQVGVACVH